MIINSCTFKEDQVSSIDLLKKPSAIKHEAVKAKPINSFYKQEVHNDLEIIDYPYEAVVTQPALNVKKLFANSLQRASPSIWAKSRFSHAKIRKCENLDNTLNDEFSEETPSMQNTFRTESNGLLTKRQAPDSMINASATQHDTMARANEELNVKKVKTRSIQRIKVDALQSQKKQYKENERLMNHKKTISIEGKGVQPYCIYCAEIYKELLGSRRIPDKHCIYCLQKINPKSLERYESDHKLSVSFQKTKSLIHNKRKV